MSGRRYTPNQLRPDLKEKAEKEHQLTGVTVSQGATGFLVGGYRDGWYTTFLMASSGAFILIGAVNLEEDAQYEQGVLL